MLLYIVGWAMLVAESLENHTAIQYGEGTLASLHLKEQPGSPCTSHMERLVAVLVPTLDTGTHSLSTYVARQFPSVFGYLFYVHNRFHERMVPQRNLRNPHRAQEMGPCLGTRLLESSVAVWTENASLFSN